MAKLLTKEMKLHAPPKVKHHYCMQGSRCTDKKEPLFKKYEVELWKCEVKSFIHKTFILKDVSVQINSHMLNMWIRERRKQSIIEAENRAYMCVCVYVCLLMCFYFHKW